MEPVEAGLTAGVLAGGGQDLPQHLATKLEQLGLVRVEKQRRRIEEQIRFYGTDLPFFSDGRSMSFFVHQEKGHRSLAKTRVCIGSNRSGKTTFEVAEMCWYATRTHPFRKTPRPPVRMRFCCTDFRNGIEKVAIPKFQEFVRREDLKGGSWETAYSKDNYTLYWRNGSFVEFMSYDQDVTKFGGASRHLIIDDEPVPIEIHMENEARLADVGGDLIMAFTPVDLDARTAWLFDFWQQISRGEVKDTEWFFFDIEANTAWTPEQLTSFKDKYNRPGLEDVYAARVLGKFPRLAGVIYKQFSIAKHVIPWRAPEEDWTIEIWADPHTRKATAAVYVGIDREGNLYVWDELLEVGTGKSIIEKIRLKLGKRELNRALSDNAIKAKNEVLGGRSIWDEFLDPDGNGSDRGIYFETVSSQEKEVLTGIRQVQEYLGLDAVYQKPKLFVMDNCTQTIHQFQNYVWDDYKRKLEMGLKEKPKKVNDDLMDCIRYGIMAGPRHVKRGHAMIAEPVYDEQTGYVIG